jgi:hypothetical protein
MRPIKPIPKPARPEGLKDKPSIGSPGKKRTPSSPSAPKSGGSKTLPVKPNTPKYGRKNLPIRPGTPRPGVQKLEPAVAPKAFALKQLKSLRAEAKKRK